MWQSQNEESTIVKVGGGGSYMPCLVGALTALKSKIKEENVVYAAASAGAVSAALTICKVYPEKSIRVTAKAFNSAGVPHRFFKLAFVCGRIIRTTLDELLPGNAAQLCTNRLIVHVTEKCGFKTGFSIRRIKEFSDKKTLCDTIMASCHVLWYMDGKSSTKLFAEQNDRRSRKFVDGTFLHFYPFKSCWGIIEEP